MIRKDVGYIKNLFAIDIDKDYGEFEPFVLRRVERELSEKQQESVEKLVAHEKSTVLPGWLRIVKILCFYFFLIVLCSVIKVGKAAFANAPILCALGAIGGVIGITLWIIEIRKTKTVAESDGFKDDVENAVGFTEKCLSELGVPDDAKTVDIFSKPYKMKNGKEKKANGLFEYINYEAAVFREGSTLCIADVNNVIGLPIENMTGIYKISKRASFMGWNKEENFRKAPYKQYKMTSNQYGVIFIKHHYSLRFSSFGEEYELRFPAYELDNFTSLTGVDVKEESIN